MQIDWKYEGFEDLEAIGFTSEYIRLDHDSQIIKPAFTAEYLLNSGFYPRGTTVIYLGKHGYDFQRENIEKVGIKEGDVLTVLSCSVGSSSSTYTFEEIKGSHNTVLFEKTT